MLDDFNKRSHDWFCDIRLSNSYYYDRIEVNLIHATSCFLGLRTTNLFQMCTARPYIFKHQLLSVSLSNYLMIASGNYHPLFLILNPRL
jgi:hypothetical protein